jgi:hypothetical protein
MGPFAYASMPPGLLCVNGCTPPSAHFDGFSISVSVHPVSGELAPGTYSGTGTPSQIDIKWYDPGTQWFGWSSGTVTLTHIGNVGETVEGTFAGTASFGSISGAFHVCRVP